MMHEEVPETRGVDTHGLQLFVNLPAREKLTAPRVLHLDAGRAPVDAPGDGVEVRVLTGQSGQATGLIAPVPAVTMLDVRLAPNAAYEYRAADGDTVIALGWDGGGTAGPAATISASSAVVFARERGAAQFRAGASGLRFLLLAGTPIGERVVFRGPFAMSDEAQAEDAFRRYRAGEMGRLTSSFEG